MHVRPLPDLESELARPFWSSARDGRLCFQRCDVCGYHRWPPAPVCPECLSPAATWADVDPRGVVVTFAVYHHVFHPAFATDVPYNVALIEVNAGPRMISNVVEIPNERLYIGLRVVAVFEPTTADVTLVKFRPCEPESATEAEWLGSGGKEVG